MGVFPSGQWGQTVNLLLSASVVRIHPRPPRTPVSNGYRSFCFICLEKGTARVDSNSNSDDRCQWQKQGGAVGAAASRMRVPPKARCSRWEPRPGFLFCAARVIHPRPPKNRNVSKYAAVLFYDTLPCCFCFILPSEQLGKNTVLHNKSGGGQGEDAAIKGGVPGADAVLHKGQLCGGKLLAVQGFVGF